MTKSLCRGALLASLVVLVPAAARADNTTIGGSVHLMVGQTPVSATIAEGGAYYDAPVVLKRSYCAEATAAETEINNTDAVLTLYHADQTTAFGTDTGTREPKSQTAARVCFIASTTETVYLRISQGSGITAARTYSVRFVETTLWANWFYIGSDYSSFTLIRNTTNDDVTVDIRWFDLIGTERNVVSATLPANGVLFYDARFEMGCYPSTCPSGYAGSVQVAHSASPEAVVGSQTTLSGSTGLSFDTILFQRRPW